MAPMSPSTCFSLLPFAVCLFFICAHLCKSVACFHGGRPGELTPSVPLSYYPTQRHRPLKRGGRCIGDSSSSSVFRSDCSVVPFISEFTCHCYLLPFAIDLFKVFKSVYIIFFCVHPCAIRGGVSRPNSRDSGTSGFPRRIPEAIDGIAPSGAT